MRRSQNIRGVWANTLLLTVSLLIGGGLVTACASYEDSRQPRRVHSYESRYPIYPRPYYREYGPWDLPSSSSYPGPPTWYGCPQGTAACYPD